MNRGADKENTLRRTRSDSYRTSYSAREDYQSRPYSSRYDSGSARHGESERYSGSSDRRGASDRYSGSSDRYGASDRYNGSSSRYSASERYSGDSYRPASRGRHAASGQTSSRASYDTQSSYQSRSYSSRYGSEAPRRSESDRYADNSYRSASRTRQASSQQAAYSRTSGMQRTEQRSYPAKRNANSYAQPGAARPARSSAFNPEIVNTIMRYLRMVNSDVLGRRRWKLLPALYLPLTCFYSEILLGLFCGIGLQGFFYKLFFGLATGLVLGGFALLFNQKIQKTIVQVELFLVSLIFIVQCLLRKEFEVYFSLGTILGTATDVMGDYGGDIIHSILTGIPVIILFMLPLVFYCIRTRRHLRRSLAVSFKRVFAIEMVLVAFVVWSLGMLCLAIGGDTKIYKSAFEITSSSDSLGLLTGFRLNEKYAMLGNTETETFDALEAMPAAVPTSTPVPAQSAAPADAAASASAAPTATPVPFGENTLGFDFAAMNAGESDKDISAINTYLSTLSASKQNAYTGLFKGKNLIMICAEALSDAVIDPQLTPTLYRLTHNGIHLSQAYQPSWGGSTSTGEYSMLLGLVPTNSDIMADTIGKNNYFTVASQMNRVGYNTLCYHNGSYTYYDRNITHMNLGFDQFIAHGNGLEKIAGRYPSDEEMISKTVDIYMNQQPFCVYYMTCDGHKPYDDDDDHRVTEHLQEVLNVYPNRYRQNTLNYICYQLELEDALAALVAKLEAAGIADDTVICICSDHYPYGLNRNGSNYIPDLYGYEPQHPWERDHNSIIIWSGCLENENRDMACEISAPTYSLDIVPTLSNLFGLEYDSRLLVGRDIFSDEIPLVLWKNGTWVTDLGFYDSEEERFYASVPVENESAYVQTINSIVKNKKSYSSLVVNTNYFQYIQDHLAKRTPAAAAAAQTQLPAVPQS